MLSVFVVQPAPYDPPALVDPYCGSFELWVAGNGDRMVNLNVWQETPHSIVSPFVRCFLGTSPDECVEAFGVWLSAIAGQRRL